MLFGFPIAAGPYQVRAWMRWCPDACPMTGSVDWDPRPSADTCRYRFHLPVGGAARFKGTFTPDGECALRYMPLPYPSLDRCPYSRR